MSETIKAKFKITKKVFQNNDFFIFGASPIPPFPDSLKLNQYFCISKEKLILDKYLFSWYNYYINERRYFLC